ncbi:MAG: fumarate hydratase, partial [bacterium]|nr:fumarate hydratase [bacterium]
MRTVAAEKISEAVAELLQRACVELPDDVMEALRAAYGRELAPLARTLVEMLIKNAEIARRERIPVCQDTGVTNVFIEIGGEVQVSGGTLVEAVNEGIRRGTREGYLRCSMVGDPLRRENTGDNTPGMVYVFPVGGEVLRIHVAPKGAGCENMSRSKMLIPADGREGVVRFVVEAVKE